MRLRLFGLFAPLFCFGMIHCVADDPNVDDSSTANDGGNNGDATTSGGDGSTSTNDGSTTNPDGSTTPMDACLANAANCPTAIESASLRVWLRGNTGVTCSDGRVAKWLDQSGAGNDSLPSSYGSGPTFHYAIAPHCGSTTIGGKNVVTFTAPPQDSGIPPFNDETLTANLNWLLGTEYTIFVVHRRSVDGAFGLVAQDMSSSPNCALNPGGFAGPQTALAFGFEPIASTTTNALYYDQHCGAGGDNGPLGQADAGTFEALATEIDELVFTKTTGHQLYANGIPKLASETSKNDLQELSPLSATDDAGPQGYVGRASSGTTDTRYNGDIAEIIGYSAALSDGERAQIEAYLKLQWSLTF